mgnify:CR=1 FL=1
MLFRSLLVAERLPERATELGRYLLERLDALHSPLVREVRGRGLLVGIELHPERASASDIVDKLAQAGVLTRGARRNTIRLAPPLIVTREQIDRAVDALAGVLGQLSAAPAVLAPVA